MGKEGQESRDKQGEAMMKIEEERQERRDEKGKTKKEGGI